MKWIKASEKFPAIERVIAKLGYIIGYAECINMKEIIFEHCQGTLKWRHGHEELQQLFWLDESEDTQLTEAQKEIERLKEENDRLKLRIYKEQHNL